MEIPRNWRLQGVRYGLKGEVCPHCDIKIFPPRDICPDCGGNTLIIKDKGEIYNSSGTAPKENTLIVCTPTPAS